MAPKTGRSEDIHADRSTPPQSYHWPEEFGNTQHSDVIPAGGKRRRDREDQDVRSHRDKRDRRVDHAAQPKSHPAQSKGEAQPTRLDHRKTHTKHSHRTEGNKPAPAKSHIPTLPLSTHQHLQSIADSLQDQSLAIETLSTAVDARIKALQHDLRATVGSFREYHRLARDEHCRAVEDIRGMILRLSQIVEGRVQQEDGPLISGWEGIPRSPDFQMLGMDYSFPRERDTSGLWSYSPRSGITPVDCHKPRLNTVAIGNVNDETDVSRTTPDEALLALFTSGNDFVLPPIAPSDPLAGEGPENAEKTQADIIESVWRTCEMYPWTLAEASDSSLNFP
jgi:hypothetical protein